MHKLRTIHLFAGAGGGILADIMLGHQPIAAVEINPYCQQVLSARQKDGSLPWFPIFDDVVKFDGKPWAGLCDIVAGGFPCQDISAAGKGAGIDGERSNLWGEMARIIREVQPRYAFVENSPMLTSRGLYRVLGDLAEMGFDAEWGVLSAADCGAPHLRERIWVVAHAREKRRDHGRDHRQERFVLHDKNGYAAEGQSKREGWERGLGSACTVTGAEIPNSHEVSRERRIIEPPTGASAPQRQPMHGGGNGNRRTDWPPEPAVGRVVNGLANRVDRIEALGNGQVPRVAAAAFTILRERLKK